MDVNSQLIKKNKTLGGYNKVFPKTFIDAIKDKETGQTLSDILNGFNMYFLSYVGDRGETRLQVPSILRRTGLWVTYVMYDKTIVVEWYASDNMSDAAFKEDTNWRVGNNVLVGDIAISSEGNWIINGVDSGIKAQGEQGVTPILRVNNNKLEVSYTNGASFNVLSDYIAAWFRWVDTGNGVGKIQISRDNSSWSDLSPEFTNNLKIADYVSSVGKLPSGVALGTIYGVGPTYDSSDTSHNNPIYTLYVYTSNGWLNNGHFTSIAAGIVQTSGYNENVIMSQKAVTEEFNKVNRIPFTDNSIANSFIKELYVSTTHRYEKIKLNFYNNYNNVVGIRVSIENNGGTTSLGTFKKGIYYNEETNIFRAERNNLTFICVLDWNKLSTLISNGGTLTEVYLTDFAFNKIYSSSLFTQEHIEDKNNPHNVTYLQTGINPHHSNNIELNRVLKGIWLFEQNIYDSFSVTIFNGQNNSYLLRLIGIKDEDSTNIKSFQLSANYKGLVKLDYWGYAYIDLAGTTSNYIKPIAVINTTEFYNDSILNLLNNNIDLCTTYIDVYPNTSYGIYEDNSGLIFVGIDAIQRAIDYYKNYSNKYNRYVIKVHGQFIAGSPSDFSSTDNGEHAIAALQSTEYISLKGDGKEKTLISAELPDNLGTSFAYNRYSAIIQNGNHTTISDMTISGINCRYTIHTDRSGLDLSNNYEQHIENCRIISNRNTGDAHSVWQSEVPHGIGISDGMKMYMENCEIITDTSVLYLHSNADFDKPFYYKCSNIKCVQRGKDSLKFAHVAAISAGIKGIFELNNINGIGKLDYTESIRSTNATDLADIIISGENNGLIGVVKPNIPKYQLRVSVNDTSVAHTIKFDSSKSAYPLIIQGNNIIGDKLNIIAENGQVYKKGGEGFAAWCIGLLPVPETSYDTNVKLANRLGDCSSNKKELGIIVDSNSYSIILDKNYLSMSNDAIISDINIKLGTLSVPCTADLYSISAETYMDMDSVIMLENLSGKDITKGLAVKRSSYGFDLATNDKECIGILLDDTCNTGVGRILTKGYISKYGGRYTVLTVGGVLTPNSHYTVNNDSKLEIGTDGEFLAVNNDSVVFDFSSHI